MKELQDYYFYSRHFQKIKTKEGYISPFVLRDYQRRFIAFWEQITGPKRIIVLKPRQAGFSTLIASKFSHETFTQENVKGIVMADKKARTAEITGMFKTFLGELPLELTPMIQLSNSEQILLDNPSERQRKLLPGLKSSIQFETANDPNAGRSGTRRWAHLSEVAFYRYMKEIDDGIQNSIPLMDFTTIVKESTANGRAGIGRPFFDLWKAAKRGETIYKPFFVAWYEVDDYKIKAPRGVVLNEYEKDLLKKYPGLTRENLIWRRLKISEYLNDDEKTILGPEERFKQDFPLDDDEAFLSTGSPVFDHEKLNKIITALNNFKPADIKDRLNIKSMILKDYWKGLRIYAPPRDGKEYFIGVDVSEGLAIGDASSAFVMDQEYNQVARWHGKIDPDILGHLLMALGEMYNNALICPEKNNMGLTTILALRGSGYSKIYKEIIEDKVTKERKERLGWVTTSQSKQTMLNELVKFIRNEDLKILDVSLAEEMGLVSRGENGNVDLNGRDRVVACCLALMARRSASIRESRGQNKISAERYDKGALGLGKKTREKGDIFG